MDIADWVKLSDKDLEDYNRRYGPGSLGLQEGIARVWCAIQSLSVAGGHLAISVPKERDALIQEARTALVKLYKEMAREQTAAVPEELNPHDHDWK